MKLLLIKDLKGTGKSGEIVNVSDGYARNYLIPRGIATPADANNINAANIRRSAELHKQEMARKKALELADEVSGLTVKVYAKSGSGKLFGSIGVAEIAAALKQQYNIEVDKKKIRLDEPIKSLGVTEVSAHMYENADAHFKVEVLPLEK